MTDTQMKAADKAEATMADDTSSKTSVSAEGKQGKKDSKKSKKDEAKHILGRIDAPDADAPVVIDVDDV